MKNRFPPDLLVVVFGPFFVIVVALVLGSAIYRASQWGWRPAIVSIVAFVFALLVAVFFFRRRRRPSRDA
jgi:membrane protein implicated in regulation of membrane protease activity